MTLGEFLSNLFSGREILSSQITGGVREGELGKLKRENGGHSTEISITVSDPRLNNGKPTVIPTLVSGQKRVDNLLKGEFPDQEQEEIAIRRAIERGGEAFNSFIDADTSALFRSLIKDL